MKLRNWLIRKLGGYDTDTLNEWLVERLIQQVLRKPRSVDVFDCEMGTYFVTVKFKQDKNEN